MKRIYIEKYIRPRLETQQAPTPPRNNGTINLHDSSISIWEETVDDEAMLADVLAPLIRAMRQWGWNVRTDRQVKKHYAILNKYHRHCRKGDLEAKISLSGRRLEVKFFQNVANVKNPHGNEYDFDIMDRMPYLLRLQTIAAISKIAVHLHGQHGYIFCNRKLRSRDLGKGGITAIDFIKDDYANSWHLDKTLGYPGGSESSYNNKSADGNKVTHGATVWTKDSNGRRWIRGIAYYNINNMWWVVTGKYSLRNVPSFRIHTHQPDNLRHKQNQKTQRAALEKLLLRAMANLDFARASLLRTKLFGDKPLFRIWHKEKQLWYASSNSGYSSDTSRAGLYTREEAEKSISGAAELEMREIAA